MSEVNLIPPQYKDLPSEVVEELIPQREFLDPDKKQESKRKRLELMNQIVGLENEEKFENLNLESRENFENKQREIQEDLIINFFKNNILPGEILEHEKEVLNKLKKAYEDNQEESQGNFGFRFSNELDENTYVNLIRKLTLRSFQENNSNIKKDENSSDDLEKNELANLSDEDFKTFELKRGETDVGVYWYQYINKAWKKLKEKGEVEWGKERIYFDIPFDKFVILRDLVFKISEREKIAVAFKHLDEKETTKINLDPSSETTRFVINFTSTEKAKLFFQELQKDENYKKLIPDRQIDYHGHKLDEMAHYASGYREKRSALKNVVENAKKNSDGSYSYQSTSDKRLITITSEQYSEFVRQYNNLPDPKEKWEKS